MKTAIRLLMRPKVSVSKIISNPPSLKAVLLFLGIAGFLRGFLEAGWLYGMQGQLAVWLWKIGTQPMQFLQEGGALFLAANILTAYLRWSIYLLIFIGAARWFGRRAALKPLMILLGLLMGLYVLPVIVNAFYLVAPLPSVRFAVSDLYQPVIGLGQVITSVWFAWVSYHIFKTACGLRPSEAFWTATLIPLLDRVLFVGAAAAIFHWKPLAQLPAISRTNWVTTGFLLAAVIAIPALIALSRRLGRGAAS